jgi:hypothetical protein
MLTNEHAAVWASPDPAGDPTNLSAFSFKALRADGLPSANHHQLPNHCPLVPR